MTDSTSGGREYVAALTGLRGVAAGFVFLFHYHYFNPDIRLDQAVPVLGWVLQFPLGFGFMGVDLFFVLSGFLLTLPFAAARLAGSEPPALGRYFRRRFLRVFPAYYAQLFLIAAIGAWFLAWRPLSGTEWAAHAVMFFNVGPDPVRPLVGLWWTLPVELSFYLLLPGLAERTRFIRDLDERDIGAVFHYVPLHSSPKGAKVGLGSRPAPGPDCRP